MSSWEAERVLLREFESSDFAAVHAYGSDPRVTRFFPWGPNTSADTRAFLEDCQADRARLPRVDYRLAIVLRSTGRVVGGCGIEKVDHSHREAMLGYVLHPEHWSQGLMTEVIARLLRIAFEDLHLHRVWALVDTENTASERVLQKNGFQREGVMREHQLIRDEWRSSYLYGILDREFEARDRAPRN